MAEIVQWRRANQPGGQNAGLGLHQPRRRQRRSADRHGGRQGAPGRYRRGLREARQLHPGRRSTVTAADVLQVMIEVRMLVEYAHGIVLTARDPSRSASTDRRGPVAVVSTAIDPRLRQRRIAVRTSGGAPPPADRDLRDRPRAEHRHRRWLRRSPRAALLDLDRGPASAVRSASEADRGASAADGSSTGGAPMIERRPRRGRRAPSRPFPWVETATVDPGVARNASTDRGRASCARSPCPAQRATGRVGPDRSARAMAIARIDASGAPADPRHHHDRRRERRTR